MASSPKAPRPRSTRAAASACAAGSFWSDATRSAADPAEIAWTVLSGPLTLGNASAWAAPVWADAPAVVQGRLEGQAGTVSLLVRDTQADNFGAYAHDGLPDAWQVQWFGQNNPLAAPDADPSGCGRTNRFSYLAGLNPLDPQARFFVHVSPPADPAGPATVTFGPVSPGRLYTVEACDGPALGAWQAVASAATAGPGETQRVVPDAASPAPKRIYRVRIELASP